MRTRIVDLDGSLTAQTGLRAPDHFDLRDWGPRIRLACSFGRFRYFERALAQALESDRDESPAATLYGSGDFHHVSLALLRRQTRPFNLLMLDNHPDWMRGIPLLHCGTWLYHAARLPLIRRIFHVGGEVDFDNAFRWLAPWPELFSGKIVVLPALRRYGVGRWRRIPHAPLRARPNLPCDPERLERLIAPYRADLAQFPLYITVDKDVMPADTAMVNWDSGHLTPDEVQMVLNCVLRAAHYRVSGADVLGDWSPVQVIGIFRRYLHFTEHPKLEADANSAARRNEIINRTLLETITRDTSNQPARRAV